jgi:hypothetical protein
MENLSLETHYKKYSNIINHLCNTYSKNHNLYNTLMYCVKSIKKDDKEALKEGLKILFTDFEIYTDSLIYVMEYLKLKKCTSFNVYCELLTYFKHFKDGRVNSNLNFN